uniref:Complement C3-like n=1 Tax=Sinocyclocheilus anshuiensis TaxID=1608454 RepID=A0A671NUY1_9TELE
MRQSLKLWSATRICPRSSAIFDIHVAPWFVLSAPNLLRVGSSENLFVEAQDYSGVALDVKIIVKNHPKKDKEILSKSVKLTSDKNFQILTDIKIPDDQNLFSDDPLEKQYVYLQAQFPSVTLEKVVLLSFQSGYIFVQTDKPIYTPASTVQYRIFSLTPNLEPLSQSGITVEIMVHTVPFQSVTLDVTSGDRRIGISLRVTNLLRVPGIWKVVTLFSNTPQKTFTADFEVKEYVLPTFEVKLKPSKSFFYVGDESLTVDIEAKYLFGQKVDGNAFVVFGVMEDEKKTSIPASLQKVQIVTGKGTAELTNQMITDTFPNINQLVGRSIYVSVSLLTESGSEMVEAERRGIQIVTSPYTIHFKKTPHFFKPGMPFDVSVYVTNPDQTPAVNVGVEVNPGGVRGQTRDNGIAKVTVNTPGGSPTLDITAKTKDPDIKDENQQAVKKMTAQAYETKGGSNNYLHIGIDAVELQIGDPMKVNLNTGQSPGFIFNYLLAFQILSKGQIVQADRFKRQGQSLVTLPVTVTKDMVPSFRFVAYYHVGPSEVVSDSVWVDVKDTCMGKVGQPSQDAADVPTRSVKLQITGDHGAKVGLVVVDKAVQVLNKNRLTQTQIWDVIEKHDTGCTAGGGRDSMGVFTDAGLMFESNGAGGTNTRIMSECPKTSKRKRRAESLLQITTGKYSGELKQCCVDGMRDNKLGYTCERRATYIVDGQACVKAFLDCCNQMKSRKNTKDEEEEMVLARSDDDDDYYTDSEEITSRTQFPESWLWEEIDLCDKCCCFKSFCVSVFLLKGICVAEPVEMVVFKHLFIDLKMPYSAVRGEQLEIKAIIHNYTPKKQKVRVEFMETEDVCSFASKKGKYRTTVSVDKGSSIAVSYVIIPMTLGNHMIEVKASAYEAIYTDGVRKPLKVVVRLMGNSDTFYFIWSFVSLIDVWEKPVLLKGDIPDDRVPDTPANTYISIAGEEIAQTVEQAISGDFMGRLIVQPSGCGEQNMIYMTLPLIATHYLDSTNQWAAVGMERRNDAINHISTGYQQQLGYRKPDGSYAAWIHRPSSTWLTAYVAKVLAMANNLVIIEENVICSALKWLVLHKQLPDGSFKEESPLYSSLKGDVRGKDADASLTAFVVIAMQEARDICAESSLHESIRKAVSFLEGRLPQLTNPYAVAMTSYAMANANKLNKDILMKRSSQLEAGRSWTVSGQHHHSLEATAYAVLALVKDKDFDKAGEAVHWLNRQQSHYGGSGTTQATIMVFQAVAEYRTQVKDRQNFNLDVELSVAGRSKPVRYTIKRENAHLTRSDRVRIKWIRVHTKSSSVKTTLNTDRVDGAKLQNLRDLSLKSYLDLHLHSFKSDKTDATMTILDIGIPTGFTVETRDLEELSRGKERYIQKFEMDKVLSERGSLILYLDTVLRKEPQRIAFRMNKILNVGLLQPAAVTIYEYYSPNARCTKFFHPERTDGAISRLCKGELCQCSCSLQKHHLVRHADNNIMCLTVYKVTVVGSDLKQDSDIYDLKVEQVLKEGTDVDVEGKVRPFLARPSCRNHLGLVEGKSYLIMGRSVDLPELGGSLQYIFGEQTWIEYWPTRQESQTPEHRQRYIGISDLQNSLLKEGCAT